MNIGIIGPAHPLRGGGISTFNERLAYALQEAGYTVTIYSFSLQYPSFLFPGQSQFTSEPPPKGLRILSIINSVSPLNWRKSGNTIAKANHDLIIVRYWLPFMGPALGTILRRIKKNGHSRIICIADNIIPHEHRPGDKAFTKYFVKPVDAFITMSREVLKDLKEFSAKPALFTPHPLYDNYGDAISRKKACDLLNLDPARKYVLFFGFIRKYKGLDILLEAMADERLAAKDIHLIVAGEFYGKADEYTPLLENPAVKNRIHLFTSFIPNDEVKRYFCAADLVAQPYRSATQSGITQVAYHFRKPMVVTNVGGLHEVVPDGETGFVASPSPAAIATAIDRFFTWDAIPKLEENIERERSKYTWSTFVEKLLALNAAIM